MNLLGLRNLIFRSLDPSNTGKVDLSEIKDLEYVNQDANNPWGVLVTVDDGTGTDTERTFRLILAEEPEEEEGTRDYVPTAYDKALDTMLAYGIPRGLADALLMDVCDLAVTNAEIEKAQERTSYLAQVKDRREGATWRTVRTGTDGFETAWAGLSTEMQRRDLRYSELSGFISDMLNGQVLTAEDGTEFRVLAPGQEDGK